MVTMPHTALRIIRAVGALVLIVMMLGNSKAYASPHVMCAFPCATAAANSGPETYGGTPPITGQPRVYLVFWGSQWGSQATNAQGDITLSGDPKGMAPYLEAFFKGIGTAQDSWSSITTQYCEGVSIGATTCPASASHVGYATGGAFAGAWVDESAPAPAQATEPEIAQEASTAASHFGNTSQGPNNNAIYVVVSPTGTDPDSYKPANFCAWHDDSDGLGYSSPDGDLNVINLPYLPDVGSTCGENWINSGSSGVLDGVSIVAGHEYAETATDPVPTSGWSGTGTESEVGDLCAWRASGTAGGAFNLKLPTGTFAVQSLWGNDANGGQGGCQTTHSITGGINAVGYIDGSGNFYARQWYDSSPTLVATSASQFVIATDQTNGPTLGYVQGGNFYAKQGLNSPWTFEASGVTHIALATDPVNGPLLGYLDSNGNFYAKQGLAGSFTLEATGATAIAVATDPVTGPSLGYILNSWSFYVKQGGLQNAWTDEAGNAAQIALASDPTNGLYIGVLINGGSFFVKQGLGGSFVSEATGASAMGLATDQIDGPTLGYIQNGNAWVKQGSLNAAWNSEATSAALLSVATDPTNGATLGYTQNENFYAKQGYGAWEAEGSSATQIAVAASSQ
jgi:hypothetical protein